ncbi:MAG: type II toxin-antitoxin system VapB family antitoxin [Methylococcaceae bacterium]|nr:type II toxin-antitoxin system VapB family antitoxin [Methylococcaceae bacterium]
MGTEVFLDDSLIQEALKYAPAKTRQELIDLALREFIANHERRDLRELKGRISFYEGYDHKALRERTFE